MEDNLIVKLRVVNKSGCQYHCDGCFFWKYLYPCDGKKALGDCRSTHRADKKNIIFVEVKE